MSPRGLVLGGMALGIGWGAAVIWLGVARVNLPVFSLLPSLAFAFIGPGLILSFMIAAVILRRFLDARLLDGGAPVPGSRADIDLRVLRNTQEQLVLALALWPPSAYLLTDDGPGVVVCLGLAFVVARIGFWLGYHIGPRWRTFGFTATFAPTVMAFGWGVLRWAL